MTESTMMRNKLFALLLLIGPVLAAADITGSWYMERTAPNGRKTEVYYVLKADGEKFTGRMISNRELRTVVNGVLSGNQITFELGPWKPADRPTSYKGELSGEELKIVVVPPPGMQGRGGQPPRAPQETVLKRTSTSTDWKPPASIAPTHKPFPPFKPIKPNGLAKTPPMGWNSWNKFNNKVDDKSVREIADAMVSSGMKDAGYLYVNIDDTWEDGRDENGNIKTNQKFPDMKALADYVHSKGLKLGIYSGPGRTTCAGYEASYGHEQQDADSWAKWGIDYLKYDWCSASAVYTSDEMKGAYQQMALALRKTKRPIILSLCQYGWLDVGEWGESVGGNLWRTTSDIRDDWPTMSRIGFDNQVGREKYAGPGHWNDPDMLEIGNGHMSNDEYKTHMSLWSILAAPLLAGNDLRSMTKETTDILCNKDVIAVDQDKLGKQGVRVKKDGDLEVWKKQLSNGVAIGLFNRGASASKMTVKWADVDFRGKPKKVRDLWAHQDITEIPAEFSADVPSHGVVMLRVW